MRPSKRARKPVTPSETAIFSNGPCEATQVAVPLAAAALGGILLVGRPSPAPAFDLATVRAARALGLIGPRPVVKAEGHQSVAVLPTDNPNITIIWFME